MFLELCIKVGKNSQVIAWCVFMNARTILDFFYIKKGLEIGLTFEKCVFSALLRLNFKVRKTWNKTRLSLSLNLWTLKPSKFFFVKKKKKKKNLKTV